MLNAEAPSETLESSLHTSQSFPPQQVYETCPGCGSVKINKIISSSVDDRDIYDPLESWLQVTEQKYFFPYHVCDDCNLFYVKEYYSDKDLSALYNRLSDNVFSGDLGAHNSTQLEYARLLTRVFPPPNRPVRILEYGPDIGILSTQLTELYSPQNYFLIEPNIKLHDQFLSDIPNSHIWENDAQLEEIEDNSVDLIVMVHVFDHILQPYDKLQLLWRKLSSGGKIFLVTHNTASLLRYVLRNNWPPYCLHHPQLYSPTSIKRMLRRVGFPDVESRRTYNYFKLGTYLSGVLKIVNCDRTFSFGPILKMPVGNIATIGHK